MKLLPLDTAAEAAEAHRSVLAGLGPEGRLRAALEMSESLREVRLEGLRARNRECSDRELKERWIAEAHGIRLGSAP